MDIFAHAGHDHGEVAAASTTLDFTTVILIIASLALITAAVVIIILVRGSLKRVKQMDGTVKTEKADAALKKKQS